MGTQPVLLLQRLTVFPKRGLIDIELVIIVPHMENLLCARNCVFNSGMFAILVLLITLTTT